MSTTLSPVGEPCTKLRLWVATALGFLCFEALLASGRLSWPQVRTGGELVRFWSVREVYVFLFRQNKGDSKKA